MLSVWEEMFVFMTVDAQFTSFSSVLYLLKELIGWVLVAVLLHLGQVAFLGGDGSIHLEGSRGAADVNTINVKTFSAPASEINTLLPFFHFQHYDSHFRSVLYNGL